MFCTNCGNKIKEGVKFCTNCGKEMVNKNVDPVSQNQEVNTSVHNLKSDSQQVLKDITLITKKDRRVWWIVGTVFLLGIILVVANQSSSNTENLNEKVISSQLESVKPVSSLESYNQSKIVEAVVNILCDNDGGGSGTIMLADGIVLTNNHVIATATYCLVTIPNPTTGTAVEIYTAKPIIVPKLSKQYDIAMLEINGVFTDKNGEDWGTYPKTFYSYHRPDSCEAPKPKLGDSIRIYGYPVTSGGYNLTVTEGIISSFSDNGNILTSAKIDSGNSGGLAVDQGGCIVGIPSAVLTGEYQNLGVIIPSDVIVDFLDKVQAQL